MHKFKAEIKLIGINPYVFVPDKILKILFEANGKDKGPIPIMGTINNLSYRQTLVKYSGVWRLYINNKMLNNSPKRIGETIDITIEYDISDRSIKVHSKLIKGLDDNHEAKVKFDSLPPSLQKEIVRYISNLKTESSIDRNVDKAIDFLLGKGSFIGRKPLK